MLFDQRDATPEHSLTIRQEAWLKSTSYRRKAIKERDEVFIVILKLVPFGKEWRHEHLDVIWLIELIADWSGQSSNNAVETQQTFALVLAVGKGEGLQDFAQVRDKLNAYLFLAW